MPEKHHKSHKDAIPLAENAEVKTNIKTLCFIIGGVVSATASICAMFYHLFAKMDSVALDARLAADKVASVAQNQWEVSSNQWRQLRMELNGKAWTVKDEAELHHQAAALGIKLPDVSEVLMVTRVKGKTE